MACNKCGKMLVKEDRGNITLGIPDGFDHADCGKAAYLEVPPEVAKEKPVVIAKEVKKEIKPFSPPSDAAPVMEQKEKRVYPKPIKRGGGDSVFKRRLS